MCGIFGHIGEGDSVKLCINGLKKLEYRGYDSAGIAGIYNGELFHQKQAGKVSALEQRIEKEPLQLNLAIAHTRWATHGPATQENAHPHFDQLDQMALVHNGIIENHLPLRLFLQKKGVHFTSDTDTEVIVKLISHFYTHDPLDAMRQAIQKLEGTWGLAFIHKNHPDQIFIAAKDNTMVVALDAETGEAFISSDFYAFHKKGLQLTFLRPFEMARVFASKVELYDRNGALLHREAEVYKEQSELLSKEGFDHFMLKEIYEQPLIIEKTLLSPIELPSHFNQITHITFIACGTSWHAGSFASLILEEKVRIHARAEIASEYCQKTPLIDKNSLVIAISQSGETLDTLKALRKAKASGAKTLAICNRPHSTLAREVDLTLYTQAGPEISVCSTKAFTAQVALLYQLALALGDLKQSLSKDRLSELRDQTLLLPQQTLAILDQQAQIEFFAHKYAHYDNLFFLGRHYMYIAALEAALKLKEISYIHATGYPAGELKHGPLALLDENTPVIGLLGNRACYEKMLSNLMEAKSRKAPILVFAPRGAQGLESITEDIIWLPPTEDELAIVGYSIACQLLAYHIARKRNTDIDQPRNLAKSVTVE